MWLMTSLMVQSMVRAISKQGGSLMKRWSQWMESALGMSPATQEKLVVSLIIIVLLWLFRRAILMLVWRRVEDVRQRYQWQKTTLYVTVVLGALAVGREWFEGFGSLATYLGLVSAGLAIALRDPLTNLAGWVFILWRRPFEVGDRIQIGDHAGDVIDVRIFAFTLLEIGRWVDADQSTGRMIHIPNGKVFTEVLANYTQGFAFIWNEIPVLVTFESNWRKAKEILHEIALRRAGPLSQTAAREVQEAARKFMIFYKKLTPTVYTSVRESGVLLTLRYLCDPRQRRASEQTIWEDILDAFAECPDVDFAYPTQRFYDNVLEGKPGMRPLQERTRAPLDSESARSPGADHAPRGDERSRQ